MPKEQLTVAELKLLLIARFSAEQSKEARLNARFLQELGPGNEVQEEESEVIAIRNKLMDMISDVIARRLKQNRRSTPLLSSRDFVRFFPLMIKEIAKAKGDELEVEKRKRFEKFMKAIFKNTSEMIHARVPPRKNPYDEYWRWVATVLALAAERGILPIEFLALESATDQITRRMFTRKQFAALSKRAVNKFMDADVIKKIMIQPMLDLFGIELDDDGRREVEQDLEVNVMPQLREIAEKSKVVINAWLAEEVERIYAAE